jgi:hypothetical protein
MRRFTCRPPLPAGIDPRRRQAQTSRILKLAATIAPSRANLLRILLAASRASTRSHVLPPRQSVNITRAIPYDKKLFYDLRNSLPLALFECPTKTLPKIAKKSDEMIVDRVISPECALSGPRAAVTLKKH